MASYKHFSELHDCVVPGDGNDAMNELSRFYVEQLREICLVDMIKLTKEFVRSFCKICKQIYAANQNFRPFQLKFVTNSH